MEIKGTLLSADDIELKTSVNRQTGEEVQRGKFRFLVSHPTALLDVTVQPEQVKSGVLDLIRGVVGKPCTMHIDYRNMSFGNDQGQHVSINQHVFVGFPEAK